MLMKKEEEEAIQSSVPPNSRTGDPTRCGMGDEVPLRLLPEALRLVCTLCLCLGTELRRIDVPGLPLGRLTEGNRDPSGLRGVNGFITDFASVL